MDTSYVYIYNSTVLFSVTERLPVCLRSLTVNRKVRYIDSHIMI